jgi:hypothetical protein
MRLTLLIVPYLILTFLPLVIVYIGHGIFGAIVWTILWLAFRQATVTYTIISKSNKINTGKSLSEALIFASTNPQYYDDRVFIEL